MIEQLILIGMVLLAVLALSVDILRQAVIYLSLFSLLCSFAYLLYSAPDVAIAEAVIGCGLATVLYLVALKRQRLMTIYFAHSDKDGIDDQALLQTTQRLLRDVEHIFADKDLETQVIHTTKPWRQIMQEKDFDLLIVDGSERLTVYGRVEDYHVDAVEAMLGDERFKNQGIQVIRFQEESP